MSAYELQQVSFHYGEQLALSLSQLQFQANQITALIGPNGSGKSTLLQLLAFLSAPSSGEIIYHGNKVVDKALSIYRKKVSFLAQKPYLLQGSVLQNVGLPLKIRGVNRHRRQVLAIEMLQHLRIEHLQQQSAIQLSGGEMQKVALARAMVVKPQVLLLDEPFSYLDQTAAFQLEMFMTDWVKNSETTVIFSTHNRLQGYAIADEVVSLVAGTQVKSPLINMYHGVINENRFSTGKLDIILPDAVYAGHHVSIDPHDIVVSNAPVSSSMRNHFQGRVIAIAEEMSKVRVTIQAGEVFQALITHESLQELGLMLGAQTWVNFKSNAVVVM